MRGHDKETAAGGDDGGSAAAAAASRAAHRAWTEAECAVDEEFEPQFGPRWQERRKRPEHAEIRRQYQRQQPQDPQGTSWEIPK
ncbi:unnamed protein product [Phytomonas sp. Hart1]|nr:unnamed protein product [Phytomonas sp. Hart1]|eukprot:CCW71883.1 unnamed protein product [Phytomonas sp. isolate Hart1]